MNAACQFTLGWCLLLAFSTNAQEQELPTVGWQGQTMGSPYLVKIVGHQLPSDSLKILQSSVEARLKEINRQMSHYQPDSELSRFNRNPATTPLKVTTDFARVMRFTLSICKDTDGALDPTLAPLINLWGFGEKSSSQKVPSQEEIWKARQKTGYSHITVTPSDELVKSIPDLTINLSAVAKGYALDQIVELLRKQDYTNVYCSIAGEVRVLGHNARSTKWQIGISAPISNWREQDPMAAVAALSDQSISTSGDYQKFYFDENGNRLCHILDPKTGRPVQHTVGGVSVVAGDSITADALSTVMFVLGVEKGLEYIERWTNAACLFVTRESDGTYRKTPSSRFSSLTGYQP